MRERERPVWPERAAQHGFNRFLATRLVAGILVGASLMGASGCNYYGKFNAALSAIERSGCAESIEYSRHEDLTLEEFNFKIRTNSGCIVRLWFDDDMRIQDACSMPVGIVVFIQRGLEVVRQEYTVADLSERLSDKRIRIMNLNDVLCNAEDLARILRLNYDDKNISRITGSDRTYKRHLKIEILEEGGGDEFQYTKVR